LGGGEQAERRSRAQRAIGKTGCAIKMESKRFELKPKPISRKIAQSR